MSPNPRCLCHVCLPEPLADPIDQETVAQVIDKGFTVIAVGTGACSCCHDCDPSPDETPAFAYTIGLPHSAGHPELVVSGLSAEVMSAMLNNAAQRVLDGFPFEPGTTAENLIGYWPVVADPMSPGGLEETALWSHWFHRRPADALQLVWPSTSGVFTWQPGGSEHVAAAQPAAWRLPQPRVGPLAADPPWPFPVPPDHLAVSCRCIVNEGAPVRLVVRAVDEDGSEHWQAMCGEPHRDILAAAGLYHFAHLVRGAPSLHDLSDLGLNHQAERDTCWSPWRRSTCTGERAA